MRIIARHQLPFGNYSSQAIEIDPIKHTVSHLRRLLSTKFKIPPSRQIIKFFRDGYHIRIVEEFPLTFYDLTEHTILIVESIEQKEHHNTKYFNKLKILQPIHEELDSLTNSMASQEEISFMQQDDVEWREQLLKQQSSLSLEAITNLIEQSIYIGLNIIDSIGNSGWNALHCACYEGHLEQVKLFIQYHADLNKSTIDGWTPLQLAIKKNRMAIFQLLIDSPKIHINEYTSKGTALHVALSQERNDMAEILIHNDADLNLCSHDGQTCLEIANNQNIINLIKCKTCKQDSLQTPLIVGEIKKVRFLMYRIKTKYMVCDPWLGTLKIYKDKSLFPMGHDKVIHLTQIRSIQKLKNQWFAPSYYFIEIIFTHRIMLAFEYEQAAQKWIDKIYQASVFQKLLQDFFKNVGNQHDQITRIQELHDISNYKELPIYDQSSINPELDIYCRQFYKRFTTSCHSLHTPDEPIPKKEPDPKQIARLSDFEVIEILGAGSFGTVYKVRHKATDSIYAMKSLKKRNLILRKQLRFAVTEANILRESNHPFVLQLHFAFQTPLNLYLITDYCAGKDISFLIASLERLSETQSLFYISEIIIAINYLHRMDILYRDLKPENVLIHWDGHIKLADFGLSKQNVGDEDLSKTFCGSPACNIQMIDLAPEMVRRKGVTKAADVYGIGCVLYEMLTGEAPFMDDDMDKLTRKIESGKLFFPNYISDPAKRGLLDKNPKNRLAFFQNIEKEPFFQSISWNELEQKQIACPINDFIEEEIGYPQVILFIETIRMTDQDYTEENKHVNYVQNFCFTR